ncbi:glycosyltransferase [Haloferax volcanii]|uniref:Glycosyltransferase n=1 Tax=Haloferax volcanii TaxID=2246 RepID=A0A6C0V1K5_HALVO|nr:glycosyltransferase [Haloferax alexandrinus]QIB79138.1 glycosyltransferase [Haloferax alexandrinus]
MSQRAKIVMLTNGLGSAGAPKVLLNICKHLSTSEFEIKIVNFGDEKDLAPKFAETDTEVNHINSSLVRVLPEVIKLLREENPEILHTHMMLANFIGRIAGRVVGIPTVSTLHTSYPNRTLVGKLLDTSTSWLPDYNIPVSDAVSSSLPAWFGLGAKEQVIHNAVDVETIRKLGSSDWDELEWTDQVNQNAPIIVNVARFDPKKRRKDLINSMDLVLDHFPEAQLILSGKINRLGSELIEYADELGLSDSIKFVGYVENPYSLYHHSDIVAFSSSSEGFSIGLLEAMAFEKPIVATDISPFNEALGSSCSFAPVGDPDSLANEIIQMLSDQDLMIANGERVKTRVESNFSGEACGKKYAEIYHSLL